MFFDRGLSGAIQARRPGVFAGSGGVYAMQSHTLFSSAAAAGF
jgi:hypothetical protein